MVFLHGQIVVTIKRADDLRSAENYGLGCTGLKCVGKGLAKALRALSSSHRVPRRVGPRLATGSIVRATTLHLPNRS